MRVRFVSTCLVLLVLGCGRSDPDVTTPEGLAIAYARALEEQDFARFESLARNPNADLLEETGVRPRPGSYAATLRDEGRTALRRAFEAAATRPVPTGELRARVTPAADGRSQVEVGDPDGHVRRVLVGMTSEGLRILDVASP